MIYIKAIIKFIIQLFLEYANFSSLLTFMVTKKNTYFRVVSCSDSNGALEDIFLKWSGCRFSDICKL